VVVELKFTGNQDLTDVFSNTPQKQKDEGFDEPKPSTSLFQERNEGNQNEKEFESIREKTDYYAREIMNLLEKPNMNKSMRIKT
jgi:hypothetical protein